MIIYVAPIVEANPHLHTLLCCFGRCNWELLQLFRKSVMNSVSAAQKKCEGFLKLSACANTCNIRNVCGMELLDFVVDRFHQGLLQSRLRFSRRGTTPRETGSLFQPCTTPIHEIQFLSNSWNSMKFNEIQWTSIPGCWIVMDSFPGWCQKWSSSGEIGL